MIISFTRVAFFLLLSFPCMYAISTDCSTPDSQTIIHSCIACNYLWDMSLNKCIQNCEMPSQFYNTSTMKCESCPEKCQQCSHINSCDECLGNLQYNYDQNKCACSIDSCQYCDFKGTVCRQCVQGFEQDINLNCIKSQHKVIMTPNTGMSLQTLFSFMIQLANVQNGDSLLNKSLKCYIMGNNASTDTVISISSGGCQFDTYLPTLHSLDIHILEYTTNPTTGEVAETNHYLQTQSVNVFSPFSSLNNLWEYIQANIKPINSLPLQIITLYEYSYQVKNICLVNNYCQIEGYICYLPNNICLCGQNSYQGMRDCSSMKSTDILFSSYLQSVYAMCLNAIKGVQFNVQCPKPITDELPDNEQQFILFLLEQSKQISDEDFVEILKTALKKLNNNSLLAQIFPELVQRYVGKYNKIFSMIDSNSNVLIDYKINNLISIDFSIFQAGQIPITFFQPYPSTIPSPSNQSDLENMNYLQENYQQLVFSNYPQRVINKYSDDFDQPFYYIKLINSETIQLSYTFTQVDEINTKQMICLQANQSQLSTTTDTQKKEALTLCNGISYDSDNNVLTCNCVGDTFLFLDDNQHLYLTLDTYNKLLFNSSDSATQQQDNNISNDEILIISLSAVAASLSLLFILYYFYHRKSKISSSSSSSAAAAETILHVTSPQPIKNRMAQRQNMTQETNNSSAKQNNIQQSSEMEEQIVYNVKVEEEEEKVKQNQFIKRNRNIEKVDQFNHLQKQTVDTQNRKIENQCFFTDKANPMRDQFKLQNNLQIKQCQNSPEQRIQSHPQNKTLRSQIIEINSLSGNNVSNQNQQKNSESNKIDTPLPIINSQIKDNIHLISPFPKNICNYYLSNSEVSDNQQRNDHDQIQFILSDSKSIHHTQSNIGIQSIKTDNKNGDNQQLNDRKQKINQKNNKMKSQIEHSTFDLIYKKNSLDSIQNCVETIPQMDNISKSSLLKMSTQSQN